MKRVVFAVILMLVLILTACATIPITPEITAYADAINPDLGKFTVFWGEEQKLSQQLIDDPMLRYSSEWTGEMWIALGMTEIYLGNMVNTPFPEELKDINAWLKTAHWNYARYKDAKWAFIEDVNPADEEKANQYYDTFLDAWKQANKIVQRIK